MFRLSKDCQLLLTLALTSLVGVGPARADFIPIDLSDAAYTSRTTLLPIGVPVTDGRLTIQFNKVGSYGLNGNYAPDVGTWSSGWGRPPSVESEATQTLCICRADIAGDILLTFSSPIKTFGLEARPYILPDSSPDPTSQMVSVSFLKGGRLDPWPWGATEGSEFAAPLDWVGTIERRVYQDQGALLFAARTTTEYFTQVWVNFRDAGWIARLRYSVGEPPAPTHAQFFARSISKLGGPITDFTGQPDQVTMNVGEILNFAYLVKFRNTGEFLDVSDSRNTEYFTDPPMGSFGGSDWRATEATRNKILTLYARYREPYTGQSITDTVRVYVRP
jgi:hypothetical protein